MGIDVDLTAQVRNVVDTPANDNLSLLDASRRVPHMLMPSLHRCSPGRARCREAWGLLRCLCACRRRLCNRDIVNRVQQVICFAFHDSRLLLQTCEEAKQERKIVTLFYLD